MHASILVAMLNHIQLLSLPPKNIYMKKIKTMRTNYNDYHVKNLITVLTCIIH
jgi:hypothetical protein